MIVREKYEIRGRENLGGGRNQMAEGSKVFLFLKKRNLDGWEVTVSRLLANTATNEVLLGFSIRLNMNVNQNLSSVLKCSKIVQDLAIPVQQ